MRSTNLLRSFNFFYFSLFSLFLSFLPVYLSAQGISKTEIGWVIASGSLIGIISQPFWGVMSDRLKAPKKVMLWLLAASVIVGSIMFQTTQLWGLFLMVGLVYFLYMPTDPLVESLNFQLSQKYQVGYGAVRMFGAMGYAVASLLIGFAANQWGMISLSYLFMGYGMITLLLAFGLEEAPVTSKPLKWQDLRQFFTGSRTIIFFLLVLIGAIPHRLNDIYLGLYVESLGGNVQLVGQAWFLMTLVEVLFFGLSQRMVKPGKELMIIALAAGVYVLRFLLTAWSDSPVWVVGLQLLQGLTFVLFYTASIQYLYAIVPEEWKATGQTVLAVLFFGISGIIGAVAGGWVFDHWGGRTLYLGMAGLSLAAAAFALWAEARRRVTTRQKIG